MENLYLVGLIEQWAEDRNLIKGSTPAKQCMKLFSEFGELADNVGINNLEEVKDGIGDVFVVTTIVTRQLGYNLKNYAKANKHDFSSITLNEKLISLASHTLSKFVSDALMSVIEEYEPQRIVDILREIAKRFDLTLDECVEHSYNEIKDRKGIMHEGIFIKEKDPRYPEIVALYEKETV